MEHRGKPHFVSVALDSNSNFNMANRVSNDGDSDDDNFSLNSDDLSAESEVERLERLAGEIFGDSDTDDEDFAGFEFEMADNIAFQVGRHPVRTLDELYVNNQPDAGPQVNIEKNAKPVDLFNIYFDDNILQQIVTFTNANAAKKRNENPQKHKGKWTDTTIEEIHAFMATMIIMNNIVCLPRFERYFQAKQQSKWYASAPGVSNIFSRDRYVQLKCNIYFCDPHMRVPDCRDPEHDKLYKIRPIVSHLQNKFDAVYECEKNISIDESMIPFKGRLKFKQRMPMKPVKYGIKLYEVCESKDWILFSVFCIFRKAGGR